MKRPSVRSAAAVATALAACVAATARMAAFGPFVEVHVTTYAKTDAYAVYYVIAKARGGATIDEVAIEPVSGPVRVLAGASIKDLAPMDRVTFQVRVEGAGRGAVRLVQKGDGARTYDVTLGDVP